MKKILRQANDAGKEEPRLTEQTTMHKARHKFFSIQQSSSIKLVKSCSQHYQSETVAQSQYIVQRLE